MVSGSRYNLTPAISLLEDGEDLDDSVWEYPEHRRDELAYFYEKGRCVGFIRSDSAIRFMEVRAEYRGTGVASRILAEFCGDEVDVWEPCGYFLSAAEKAGVKINIVN